MNHGPVNIYPLLWLIGMMLFGWLVCRPVGRRFEKLMGGLPSNEFNSEMVYGACVIAMAILCVMFLFGCAVGLYDLIFYGIAW